MARRDEIVSRLKSVTPGPWAWDGVVVKAGGVPVVCGIISGPDPITHADAEFIANAPSDITYLLELLHPERLIRILTFSRRLGVEEIVARILEGDA